MISCLGAPGTWFLASSQGYAWTSVLTHVLPGQVCPRSLVRSKGICKGETIFRIKRVDVNQREKCWCGRRPVISSIAIADSPGQ